MARFCHLIAKYSFFQNYELAIVAVMSMKQIKAINILNHMAIHVSKLFSDDPALDSLAA